MLVLGLRVMRKSNPNWPVEPRDAKGRWTYDGNYHKAKDVIGRAAKMQPVLNRIGGEAAESVGARYTGQTKSVRSLVNKVARKQTSGIISYTPETAKDHVRGTIILKDWADASAVIAHLAQSGFTFESTIGEALNKFGYMGVHGSAHLSEGVNGEIQLHSESSWTLKMETDKIYRKWRSYTGKVIDSSAPKIRAEYLADIRRCKSIWKNYWTGIPLAIRSSISDAVMGLDSVTAPNVSLSSSTHSLEELSTNGPVSRSRQSRPSANRETSQSTTSIIGVPPTMKKSDLHLILPCDRHGRNLEGNNNPLFFALKKSRCPSDQKGDKVNKSLSPVLVFKIDKSLSPVKTDPILQAVSEIDGFDDDAALAAGQKLGLSWSDADKASMPGGVELGFSFEEWKRGLRVELEHLDVTHGDVLATARIALAHLRERPDYYSKLQKMEASPIKKALPRPGNFFPGSKAAQKFSPELVGTVRNGGMIHARFHSKDPKTGQTTIHYAKFDHRGWHKHYEGTSESNMQEVVAPLARHERAIGVLKEISRKKDAEMNPDSWGAKPQMKLVFPLQKSNPNWPAQRRDKHGRWISMEGFLSVDDIQHPHGDVELPPLPNAITRTLGKKTLPLVLKENIIAKNKAHHRDLTPEDDIKILKDSLYEPDILIRNKPSDRPHNWVFVKKENKHRSAVVELDERKGHYEVVNWHYMYDRQLKQKISGAGREGSRIILIAKSLSTPAAVGLSAFTSGVPTHIIPPVGAIRNAAQKNSPILVLPLSKAVMVGGYKTEKDGVKGHWRTIRGHHVFIPEKGPVETPEDVPASFAWNAQGSVIVPIGVRHYKGTPPGWVTLESTFDDKERIKNAAGPGNYDWNRIRPGAWSVKLEALPAIEKEFGDIILSDSAMRYLGQKDPHIAKLVGIADEKTAEAKRAQAALNSKVFKEVSDLEFKGVLEAANALGQLDMNGGDVAKIRERIKQANKDIRGMTHGVGYTKNDIRNRRFDILDYEAAIKADGFSPEVKEELRKWNTRPTRELGKSASECSFKLDYKTEFQGIPVSVENRKGSYREGTDKSGNHWRCKMLYAYGRIPRSMGADGDMVDVYLGPVKDAPKVYIVKQLDRNTKKFDEYKCFLGFESETAARRAYKRQHKNYSLNGGIITISVDDFKAKLSETRDNPRIFG